MKDEVDSLFWIILLRALYKEAYVIFIPKSFFIARILKNVYFEKFSERFNINTINIPLLTTNLTNHFSLGHLFCKMVCLKSLLKTVMSENKTAFTRKNNYIKCVRWCHWVKALTWIRAVTFFRFHDYVCNAAFLFRQLLNGLKKDYSTLPNSLPTYPYN